MEFIFYATSLLFRLLYILIIVRIVMSWLPINKRTTFMKYLYMATEPILAPIRNLLAKTPLGGNGMMLDFSPLIAILILNFLSRLLY